jgi:hypothetical protein
MHRESEDIVSFPILVVNPCDRSVFVTTVREDHAGEVFQDIAAPKWTRCQFDDHDSSPAKTGQIDQ